MEEIDFSTIEKKWQGKWEAAKIFEASDQSEKPKYYVLEMFPYPSGSGLHMGHAWNYTIGDILARYKIMNGFNVMHPMGYDALGLPAENAAIKAGTHPEDYNKKSIQNYIKQQRELGLSYDWSRILSTDDPKYYRWDQWIFLKMLEKGLAYQKTSAVNWCPECETVLANEQVQDGKCWRHEDTDVNIKHLKQWFFKITEYADELYENLDNMDWPDKTKAMQKNWIGKSHGTEIDFEINNETWTVFTTRPDTIFGVTFVVVSAQHKKLMELVTEERTKNIKEFLKNLGSISEKELADMEKLGVFTGSYAINPANGEKIPVYAGNFVVADYGSGMVMAVPAHDQRDFEFAKKYDIGIQAVVCPRGKEDFENFEYDIDYSRKDGKEYVLQGNSLISSGINGETTETYDNYAERIRKEIFNNTFHYRAWKSRGELIHSKQFNGLDSKKAKEKITEWLVKEDKGRKVINFKLRDWGISRQRYWGTPIPIIHCEDCGAVAVPENELPVKLPRDVTFGEGNPLETNADWINTTCPKCGNPARRETDTMDTFVNSSWYFLRYCDPNNSEKIFDEEKVKYWSPVDTYIGGAEHACMHLIYSRFYVKFLRDLGMIDFDEPAKKLFHQGMLNGEGGIKMSKSKGNVVLPETVSGKFGIDTARFFLSGLASPDKNIDWDDKGIIGSVKFVSKIFRYFENIKFADDNESVLSLLNQTIKNVSGYYDNFEYRKATIELRELFDLIDKNKASKETLGKFLQILNPICPHITEELWEKLGNDNFISTSDWPKADESKIVKKGQSGDLNDKVIESIKSIIEKVEGDFSKIYIYIMPFEISKIDSSKISDEIKKTVEVFAVNDKDKHDPQGKAKKAKPGKPSIYLE
ncbi:leucine--tRNA ligase [Candidatus Pacearchaeota archaeon]|nr:leucine--tRNA ligase [Candidatus Pacearchaeota archaeon]